MYKLKAGVSVDVGTELEAMVRFTAQRWDNVPNLRDVLELVYQLAARNARARFNRDSIAQKFLNLRQHRDQLIEEITSIETYGTVARRDKVLKLTLEAGMGAMALQDIALNLDGEWDFEDSADCVYSMVLQHHEDLSKARPKGWEKLAENYVEYSGMSDYDAADEKLFDGADSQADGAHGYPHRIALPYVMYDEFEQGHRAAKVLVSAAYAHFLRLVEHGNTEDILAEMRVLETLVAERQPIYTLELGFTHPVLKTLMDVWAYDKDTARMSRQAYMVERLRANTELPSVVGE
jgi:hypothetical protein